MMSVYHGKLLELVAIERKSDKCYLHIRFSFEQDIEIYWEIDDATAKNLSSATEFDNIYKYRLSFHSSWDELQKQHISLLTRTYREQSERIYFPCSESYINQLADIKSIQNINDIDTLAFISTNLQQEDEQLVETKQEKQDEVREELKEEPAQKRYNHKSILAFITVMSILTTILLGFSSRVNQENPEKVLAQSIKADDENALNQSVEIESETNSLYDEKLHQISSRGYNRKVESLTSDEPTIPFIELEESITYSITEGNVALTFDDGPSIYSKDIVDVLKEYEVGGTFFYIGLNVNKYPEYVQYVHSKGYPIGSHSMNHVDVSTLSYEKQKDEFLQSCQLIEDLIDEDVILIRPPYGAKNNKTRALTDENEYKMVLWNNDPKDWQTRNADKILSHIKNSDVSGSIIILHESQAILDALPIIIKYLQEQGLKIVSLQ